ncbi:hypothetical protein [Desulfonema magnum]|uniref:hypothetical protein n=1 Tax=Desulfonema magnum TaxID=45655 RepID=UPI00307D2FDB
MFDQEKLLALNADHIKVAEPKKLIAPLIPFLKERGIEADDETYLEAVIKTLNIRSKTLKEMAEGAEFYFQDDISYDEKAAKKFLKPVILEPLRQLATEFESLDQFDEKTLERVFVKVMEAAGLKLGKIAQPVRVALTGKTASPGIFEIIEVLGKTKVLSRLKKAVQFIVDKNENLS